MGGNDSNDSSSQLLQQQIDQQNQETEEKRQNLMKTRMDIVKSSGAQDWGSNTPQKK